MVKCPKNFSYPALLEGVQKNKEAANKKVSELQAQIDDIKKQVTALDNQEKSIHDKISALQKNVSDINTANTNLNKSITAVTSKKNVAVKNNNERENKLKLYNDELKKLETEPNENILDIESIKNQANDMRTKISDLKAIVDQKEKAKQALILVQQSMLDNRKAEYNSISIKLITEELGPKGVQGELVKEILEPIRSDIETNLKLMGFECKTFFQTESDTGKEIFQFGWINEKGHEVNFDALSTG